MTLTKRPISVRAVLRAAPAFVLRPPQGPGALEWKQRSMGHSPGGAPLVFDGHNDTVLSLERTGRSFFERSDEGHIDLPRARAGGLGGGFSIEMSTYRDK